MTGRAARWRCHMWRSERLVGVTSITTRKKRAEKVVLPGVVQYRNRKRGKKCWCRILDLCGLSNVIRRFM